MALLALIGLTLVVAVAMDGWSAWIHGRLWHGPWWGAHASHHRGERDVAHAESSPGGRFELNDVFGVCHAAIAAPLMAWGLQQPFALGHGLALGVSCGMTLFGAAYFVVHDGLVHGRLPVGWLRRWRYFRRVEAAHRVHHRGGGVPFGLFFGPWTLRYAARRQRRNAPCRKPA